MSDKLTILGSLILLGLSYPAVLTIWWLFFPERVEAARMKIVEEPRRSFWIGVLVALGAALPGAFFFAIKAPLFQIIGWVLTARYAFR